MDTPTEINFKVEAVPKENKKRSLTEAGMNIENENHSGGVDLELKLSLPGSSSVPKAVKPTNSEASLPSLESLGEYLSSLMGIERKFGVPKDKPPPLVVMGCRRCMIYVMVSKADPKCPSCKNSNLIDEFQGNPSKKLKTSLN